MKKLQAVEIARQLMTEGQDWGVLRWLFEKSRVRQAADRATEALADANAEAKSGWSDDLKAAWAELAAQNASPGDRGAKRQYEKAKQAAANVDPKIKLAARRVKDADEKAAQAVSDAEALFAASERRLSADMAHQAARKAIESYDLREQATRKAEAARRATA